MFLYFFFIFQNFQDFLPTCLLKGLTTAKVLPSALFLNPLLINIPVAFIFARASSMISLLLTESVQRVDKYPGVVTLLKTRHWQKRRGNHNFYQKPKTNRGAASFLMNCMVIIHSCCSNGQIFGNKWTKIQQVSFTELLSYKSNVIIFCFYFQLQYTLLNSPSLTRPQKIRKQGTLVKLVL